MAVGTTFNHVLKRNDVIKAALKKVRAFPPEGNISSEQLDDAIQTLANIIRAEDLRGAGQNLNLWALSENNLILVAESQKYTSSEGLASDIIELISISYRNTDGDDTPLELISRKEWAELDNKNEFGTPEKVYFDKNRLPGSNFLYVWPVPSSVTAGDEVTGSDANNYTCIQTHTSDTAANKPITGDSYTLFWKQTGSAGSAWADATEYSNGELLHYTYKRPLWDFDGQYDNPDMPQGWEQFLIFELAAALSADYNLSLEERNWLRGEALRQRAVIFPGTRANITSHYNKSLFY